MTEAYLELAAEAGVAPFFGALAGLAVGFYTTKSAYVSLAAAAIVAMIVYLLTAGAV